MDRSLFTLMSDDDDKRHTCFLGMFILQQNRINYPDFTFAWFCYG